MEQMKTLNGYEITDAKAREQIKKLSESLFEETIILSCGDAFTNID